MARNESELEQAIYDEPTNQDAWQVYADWLESQGDPRGELIQLEVAQASAGGGDEQAQLRSKADALIKENLKTWLDDDLITGLENSDPRDPVLAFEWRYGFIWSARVRNNYEWSGADVEQFIKALLKSSASRFLHEVRVGLTDPDGEPSWEREMLALSEAGTRPSVRRVYIGDFAFPDETEISWTDIGSVHPLYTAFPNLDWLKVQGGGIELGQLQHEALETLIIHTGGLPDAAARSLGEANLPRLHTLEVWFGEEGYGGSTEIEAVDPLLSGKVLPSLQHLGLQNSTFADELPHRLANSAVLPRLKTLNLSMGILTDTGGQVLLDHADRFSHLSQLNVHDNVLSDGMVDTLRERFGPILVSDRQKEYEEDYLYVSVGE